MPRRIILPDAVHAETTVSLEGELFLALRQREPYQGEIITVQDASGKAFRGRIIELRDDQARVVLFEELSGPAESPFDLFLFQALPEKERMELIIQKGVELGVAGICPFQSRHSISLEDREISQPKTHRWQHIALKAAKQCRRASVPVISPFCSFEQALEQARPLELKIILWEKGKGRLASLIRNTPAPRSIALMVGPEGGWAEAEIQQAQSEGFSPAGLGGRILRTETAAIAACAILQYEWGGL